MLITNDYALIRPDLTLAYKHITHDDNRPTVVILPGGPGYDFKHKPINLSANIGTIF